MLSSDPYTKTGRVLGYAVKDPATGMYMRPRSRALGWEKKQNILFRSSPNKETRDTLTASGYKIVRIRSKNLWTTEELERSKDSATMTLSSGALTASVWRTGRHVFFSFGDEKKPKERLIGVADGAGKLHFLSNPYSAGTITSVEMLKFIVLTVDRMSADLAADIKHAEESGSAK